MQKVIEIRVDNHNETVINNSYDNKDWAILKAIEKYAKKNPQSNLVDVKYTEYKKNTKLALVLMPSWAIHFIPFGLAKISAIAQSAGYQTNVFDINIKSWHYLQGKSNSDYWNEANEWFWRDGKNYINTIHPALEPLFNEYVDKIVEINPTIVGFSVFLSNEYPTLFFINKLKKRLPTVKILLGGPQTNDIKSLNGKLYKEADYVIQGEGEQSLLDLLDKIENNVLPLEKIFYTKERLNLDKLPISDYDQFNFDDYKIPNAINIEFTRGCVAQCVFCAETTYWKFRGRQSFSVINEIRYLYEKYNINLFWFVDSLVNGNLNELRGFALGIIELGLKINWVGNARCDGRMDYDYFVDLASSGCSQLLFGAESGSNKVLTLMKKKIVPDEIENNFKNANAAGIIISSNWLMGFPGEEIIDVALTMLLIGRTAPYHQNGFYYTGISAMQLAPGTEVERSKENYKISSVSHDGGWCTIDKSNTKLHRLIRAKTLIILFHELAKKNNSTLFFYRSDDPVIPRSYLIDFKESKQNYNAQYEDIDLEIIKPNINAVADSAVNEIWPLLWTLWKLFGAYYIQIKFDPYIDHKLFTQLNCNFKALYEFDIDTDGNWNANFKLNYHQEEKENEDNSFNFEWESPGHWSE